MAEDGIAITGATATGKTALGIAVALRIGGEIVSMDSRQVYQGMDIGTAKPPPAERRGVPHHGFDLVSPAERFSAGRFARAARRWIADIRARGHVPILVGGTGFFLRALTHPMFREPDMPPDRRERLKRYLDELPLDTLVQTSHVLDPCTADRLTPGDRQRHARSVEVALLTGQPLSRWQDTAPPPEPPADLRVFVLEIPPALLRDRIDARVATMIDMGLRGEVARLLAGGYATGAPGMDATGYAEMIPHLAGEYDLDEAVERIRAATRRYARRQRTWLRRQLPPGAVRLDATRSVDDLADEVVRDWKQDRT
jgi:tRNA dimethylallyltransferase